MNNNKSSSPKGFIWLNSGLALVISGLLLVGVISMALVIGRGIGWAWNNIPSSPGGSSFSALNPLPALKKFFSRDNKAGSPPSGTIKVISEESQVIDVVKKSTGAVVSIVASAEVPRIEQCFKRSPMIEGLPPEFENFFGFEIPGFCERGTETRRVGAGTGFLVAPDGYIITNKHVVAEEKADYTVVLNDEKNSGKKVKARVLARDPINDIAILKIEGNGYPHLNFGDSVRLQVGQTAIAIGFALGEFDNTVSKGVVSGLKRSITAGGGKTIEELHDLIQTDAAINPGNSGGPLLDIGGNVIGVNVAVASGQSIGFAIPAAVAKSAYDQVRSTGTITAPERSYLGVRFTPVTDILADNKKLPYNYGMLVVKGEQNNEPAIMPGSPAAATGIKENDIILEADGQQLNERLLLSDIILSHKPGEKISLKIATGTQIRTIEVTLGKR